jgi:[protein-PII] uridylyltransferase
MIVEVGSAAPTSMEKLPSSDAWQEIRQEFLNGGQAAPVLAGLTELTESVALEAYSQTLGLAMPGGLAILAVGGFGRRDLFPCSDVDIMILLEREFQGPLLKEALSEFVRLLWDAGLRLSHSVRTIAECTEVHEQNIELNISLLDRRLLGGDSEVYAKLESKLPAFLEKQAEKLTRHLCRLSRTRHSKYHDTLYHLEPDVKETPGGLRDLHLIGWLEKLRKKPGSGAEQLSAAAGFLGSLRCFLHYQARRDHNLLTFDAQEAILDQPFTSVKDRPLWMREYFRHARSIYREARRALDASEKSDSSLLAQLRDWRSRLSNADFTVSRERVLLREPAQLGSNPALAFKLCEFVARHGLPLAADTEWRLEQGSAEFAAYCAQPRPLWQSLQSILGLPHAAMALRAMHNTGLLECVFPEWQRIAFLVVPDFYHRYTVDEHTLVAIEQVGALPEASEPARLRFAELLSEIDSPAVLRFALLFHDTGKGTSHGDHSQRSLELARAAMWRIQMPAEERRDVEFLIEHHLDLSAIMNTRDLQDPATVRTIASQVGTIERLKLLTLLTYADISAVNPDSMTPWRLEQLWRAYNETQHELTRELETDRIKEVPKELPERAEFLKGLPVRYLRTHTPEEIEAHLQLRERSRPTGVAVQLDRPGGVYRVTIVARDRPFLFASLAGTISSFGMDILKAQAFSNAKGLILDTFVFADPHRTLDLNPPERDRIQRSLKDAALGKLDVQRLLRDRPQPPKRKHRTVEPRVQFDSSACDTATLVEIVAEDRPGLLYELAVAFSSHACNIDVVLIDTQGRKAVDVFYVASEGTKLTPALQASLQPKLLAIC